MNHSNQNIEKRHRCVDTCTRSKNTNDESHKNAYITNYRYVYTIQHNLLYSLIVTGGIQLFLFVVFLFIDVIATIHINIFFSYTHKLYRKKFSWLPLTLNCQNAMSNQQWPIELLLVFYIGSNSIISSRSHKLSGSDIYNRLCC